MFPPFDAYLCDKHWSSRSFYHRCIFARASLQQISEVIQIVNRLGGGSNALWPVHTAATVVVVNERMQ